MMSTNRGQNPNLGMLSTFPSDLDVGKSTKKLDEQSDAYKLKKQQDIKDAVKKVSVLPYRQGSTSPEEVFYGMGDRLSGHLSLHPLEPELEDPPPQLAPADITPYNIEQDLQGFGAQLDTAVDPRDDSALLGNDLKTLGSGGM